MVCSIYFVLLPYLVDYSYYNTSKHGIVTTNGAIINLLTITFTFKPKTTM